MRVLQVSVEMILRPLRSILFQAIRSVAVRDTVYGIEIIDTLAGENQPDRISRVAAALALIERYDPVVLLRLRGHLRAVVVNDSRTGYLPYQKLCVLNSQSLDRQTPGEIALNLAHEVAHAVFHRAGIPYVEPVRTRIEEACVRAEVRLARKLPGGEDLATSAAAKLNQPWWSDADLESEREAQLRAAEVPEWVIRLRRRLRTRGPDHMSSRRRAGTGAGD